MATVVYVLTYRFCDDVTTVGVADSVPVADRMATEHVRLSGTREARAAYAHRSMPWHTYGDRLLAATVAQYERYFIETHEVQQ